jgi:hypothetical protein
MSNNIGNVRRAFAEVVSIEAWHKDFTSKRKSVDVRADVAFGEARVDGGKTSPVRFKLRLRRAVLVAKIPQNEPGSILKSSIYRADSHGEIKLMRRQKKEDKASAEIRTSAGVGHTGVHGEMNADLTAKTSFAHTEEAQSTQKLSPVKADYRFDGANDAHQWLMSPSFANALDGRPWDARAQILFKFKDKRSADSKSVPPTLQFALVCRREDLIIEDIELKDRDLWSRVTATMTDAKMIAAETYIRDELLKYGLECGDLRENFSSLTLAELFATAERD